jgi:hypothetical protein
MNCKLGYYFASIHLAAFIATVMYIEASYVEQASLIWLIWFPIDLPWSLLHLIGGEGYSVWLDQLSNKSMMLGYIFYTPYLVHGIIGTVWWFFLPEVIRSITRAIKGRAGKQ